MTRGVPTFSDRDKERALAIIRENPTISLSDLTRRCNAVSESTLARWRKEIQDETGNMQDNNESGGDGGSEGDKRQKVSDRQRVQSLEKQAADYLHTIKVQNIVLAYFPRYSQASEADRKDIEIEYLVALLAEFGCEKPFRLSVEEGQ